MTLELALLMLALVPALLRGWLGWRLGATVEARWVLTILFAFLVAIRFWEGTTDILLKILVMEPRILAASIFLVLFIAAAAFGGLIFGLRAGVYQSVLPNYFDKVLGTLLGLFSGLMLGGGLLLLVGLAAPQTFDTTKLAARLDNIPQAVFQAVEKNVAGIPINGSSRTLFPRMETAPEGSAPPPLTWN